MASNLEEMILIPVTSHLAANRPIAWSQAWGWASQRAHIPGYSLQDPARPSLNERREAIPQWAHHLQGEVKRSLIGCINKWLLHLCYRHKK
ncbi:hypothetical protein AMECASPLE_000997 [Ameca splendens]|uniref:Uncharacterized protein n=1 Tax=Ameca splendens TaxID=208324 RepID=A0ABV0Z801_9TELE